LTERCSQQSIRGSKWDYVGAETARRYEQSRAQGENNKLVTTVADGLNICRTVLKFRGSIVVTVHTAQWSLYVPHSLTFNNSTFCPHSVFMCFVWITEQTAIISLYNINWLVCITETECVYCAVRTGSLCVFQVNLSL